MVVVERKQLLAELGQNTNNHEWCVMEGALAPIQTQQITANPPQTRIPLLTMIPGGLAGQRGRKAQDLPDCT
jgi:hypothetical protein